MFWLNWLQLNKWWKHLIGNQFEGKILLLIKKNFVNKNLVKNVGPKRLLKKFRSNKFVGTIMIEYQPKSAKPSYLVTKIMLSSKYWFPILRYCGANNQYLAPGLGIQNMIRFFKTEGLRLIKYMWGTNQWIARHQPKSEVSLFTVYKPWHQIFDWINYVQYFHGKCFKYINHL